MSELTYQQVSVKTAARLHMGFYDLRAEGRYGSVGLALDMPYSEITLSLDSKPGNDTQANEVLAEICQAIDVDIPIRVTVLNAIPRHAGFGSGTQLAMSIGAGLNQMLDLKLSMVEIALLSGRGRRSGIGIAAFETGGFLLDAGKLPTGGNVPQVLERLNFPAKWRVLLVQDVMHVGVYGEVEKKAFQALDPMIDELRDMVFSQMLPALRAEDLPAFGDCIARLQTYNGDYFAPIQGGQYASQDVEVVLHALQEIGAVCVGQSSWGPTGFAIAESEMIAREWSSHLQAKFQHKQNIRFSICRGRNYGAIVKTRQI
ncbi:MAG TPA: GHMP kinase [Methylophilus sp.]|nr:GHMP kinase [Methylophilus sp.]HQQ33650.1 GHMP kinase [Methylophilus sp.]